MREEVLQKVNLYNTINDMALKGEIVIFGSTFSANFPFYELQQNYVMNSAIYNRSIENLTVKEALSILQPCVLDVKPEKVFLSFGENEKCNSEFLNDYKKLVYKIKEKLPTCKIFILTASEHDEAHKILNKNLAELTEKINVKLLHIDYGISNDLCQYKKIFKNLSCFFRKSPISFFDAFAVSKK